VHGGTPCLGNEMVLDENLGMPLKALDARGPAIFADE